MRERRSRQVVTLALALACLWGTAVAATELEPGIYRVDGIDETLPNDDLAPLAGIIKKAEIVGLGESVHTVGGYYQAKFRIFKYLVEELGFRAFGFESSWIAAEEVAEYVQSCKGTPRNAIRGLFNVWRSDTVRDLAQWMCEWNREHPDDRVHFYGFDIQQTGDLFRLRSRLIEFGLEETDSRLAGLTSCLRNTSLSLHESCLATLDEVDDFLDENAREIERTISEDALAWARIHAVGIRAYENHLWFLSRDFDRSFEARDLGMAYVAAAIRQLRFPEARTAIWAHNGHIAKGRLFGRNAMGNFLKKAFKRKYRVIGLVAHKVSVAWPQAFGCGPLYTAADDSVEGRLRALGEPYLLVDLKFPGGKPPFLGRGRKYELGRGWQIVPKKHFEALFYLENAEKMRSHAWPSC